jgi:cytochrome c-type biogenesis protein CcmH/NrfG
MELENNIKLQTTLKKENLSQPTVEEIPHDEERPLPEGLRYFMVGLLVLSLVGVISFGYMRQSSVKPPPATTSADGNCKDPVTENRLRETLKQSPNDFATLMDWGSYNLSCDRNYAAAVAAYRQASELSDRPNSTNKPEERTEAHFRLGLAYFYNQSIPEARAQFEMLIQENPKDASALFALGSSYRDDPAKASIYLKRVAEISPGSEMAQLAQTMLDEFNKVTPAPQTTTRR